MNFQEQLKEDIKVCFNEDEFAISVTHTFGNLTEPLPVLFKAETDVVLSSSSSKYEFEGGEATVPMITVQNVDAANISHDSLFDINGVEYEVIHKEPGANVLKIYLGINE